ncbi:MAG TPA: response regulator [Pyrinomonadaceae bacterium]|nr:response regulator [Pyrinomonadaceae bacterium]
MRTINSKKLAFIVVDDENERDKYKIPLERDGFTVEFFESEEPALAALDDLSPDIAIVHFAVSIKRTLEFIERIHLRDFTVSIVYLTYYSGEDVHQQAMEAGAFAVLQKPLNIYDAEFIQLLRDALAESKRRKRGARGKRQALVLMPFAEEFDEVYSTVKEVFEHLGYRCERMDDIQYVGNVMTMLYEKLEESEFIIADITGNNPNVFYEIGYADALSKIVIILKHESSTAPFDVHVRRSLIYEDTAQLKEALTTMVKALKES